MYAFLNTQNGLNCASISHDGLLGRFFIKGLWPFFNLSCGIWQNLDNNLGMMVMSRESVGSVSPPTQDDTVSADEDYVQRLVEEDSHTPGYSPPAPNASSSSFNSFISLVDAHHAQWGYYPIEILSGSEPLEFIVYYPCPWESHPPPGEWSMVVVIERFLDHIMGFEGE